MNLSMLGSFKYGNFLLQNFQWLLARIGIIYQPPHLDILLPVGISFYTFHSLSYTLDIYRGVLQPTKSLRDFVLAVSFFPQLVAGPIVRAGDFLPQLVSPPGLRAGQFLWGLLLMIDDADAREQPLKILQEKVPIFEKPEHAQIHADAANQPGAARTASFGLGDWSAKPKIHCRRGKEQGGEWGVSTRRRKRSSQPRGDFSARSTNAYSGRQSGRLQKRRRT